MYMLEDFGEKDKTHSGNHAINDFKILFDYTLNWDLLIWDLKGGVCFGNLIKFFVLVHQSTLSFSCICSVLLSHTPLTADILLFAHFHISLCEVLLIHTPCLLHDYTYLILFLSIFLFMNFSFLIMILSVVIILSVAVSLYN